MPSRARVFYGTIPGTLEVTYCHRCEMEWIGAPPRPRKRRVCIFCRGPLELRDSFQSDGRLTLDVAKAGLKALKEVYDAEHPKPPKRKRKRKRASTR